MTHGVASTTRTVASTVTASHHSPAPLPSWPFTMLFAGFPVWWALGLVDVVWIPMAGVMALLLASRGTVRVPQGIGWWIMFLLWSATSVVMIGRGTELLTFGYRWLLYLAAGVLFVYVFNARSRLTTRFVTGCLTVWFAVTAAGGYLGLAFPNAVLRTPLSMVLPSNLLNNDLVNHMVVRRMAQYNPDSFLQVAPRPSAPFLYTNNWGNVYSLLLPFVVAYLLEVRGTRRFWIVVALLPISAVPALLTLNRGMFIGVGLAALYVAVRALLVGNWRLCAAVVALGLFAVALFQVLPVGERLGGRLSDRAESTSNDTRASLYEQSIDRVSESPVFGFGVPQEGTNPDAAPVGTQGQVWMLLVSHGPVATGCWVVFFLIGLRRAYPRRDHTGMACGTVLLVGTVEMVYYGFVPYGLPIMMVAAAVGMRGVDRPADADQRQPPNAKVSS